jgi:hypothetical protein
VAGVFQISTTGVIVWQARASAATNAITIHRTSYLRAVRLK